MKLIVRYFKDIFDKASSIFMDYSYFDYYVNLNARQILIIFDFVLTNHCSIRIICHNLQ